MFADLSFQLAHGAVNGDIHICRRFLGAENFTGQRDGDFAGVAVAFNAQTNLRFDLVVKIAIQFSDFFVNVVFY